MDELSFRDHNFITLSDALDIAEDVTGNHYKFSITQWKRHRYDIKTRLSLKTNEISKHAFALLNKGSSPVSGFEPKTKNRDCYFICLQDHRILKALERDRELGLLPLLIYIFTHELVHIVRFCSFLQRFDASGKEKDREEAVVHSTTFEILEDLNLPKLDYVLDVYQGHRLFEIAV